MAVLVIVLALLENWLVFVAPIILWRVYHGNKTVIPFGLGNCIRHQLVVEHQGVSTDGNTVVQESAQSCFL